MFSFVFSVVNLPEFVYTQIIQQEHMFEHIETDLFPNSFDILDIINNNMAYSLFAPANFFLSINQAYAMIIFVLFIEKFPRL